MICTKIWTAACLKEQLCQCFKISAIYSRIRVRILYLVHIYFLRWNRQDYLNVRKLKNSIISSAYVHIFNGYAVSTRKDEKLNISKCLIYDLSQYTVSKIFEKSAQFTWLCSLRDNTILRIEYCNIFFFYILGEYYCALWSCNYWLVSEKYFCIS